MLVHPLPYTEEVKKLFAEKVFPNILKYKYYFINGYASYPQIEEYDYNAIQRISKHEDDILGWMGARLDRELWAVTGLEFLSFQEKPSFLFGKDGVKFFNDLIDVYRFKKLTWEFTTENPAYKMYRQIVNQYDGTIIDLLDTAKLPTGEEVPMVRAVITLS
ncbi:MAG TPA: hypothetical protein P5023_06275 [Bacteroidales bacterium]|nr:hypothetical protein [Bacteroidales bacterium]